jgi:hypothetical protein
MMREKITVQAIFQQREENDGGVLKPQCYLKK